MNLSNPVKYLKFASKYMIDTYIKSYKYLYFYESDPRTFLYMKYEFLEIVLD